MKTASLLITLLIVVFSANLLPGGQESGSQPTELPVGSAMVAESKGEVTLRSPQGQVVEAQRGLVLPADSTIETEKGSVVLNLQDGSQVLVKGHAKVVLRVPSEPKGYFLELLLGKIFAKVQKRLGTNPSFRMGTPTAVITVRGTRFSVEVTKKGQTYVEVFEGVVEVMGIGFENRPVLLRPGFSTGVRENREPDQPRKFNEMNDQSEQQPGRNGPGERENQQPRTGAPTGEKPEPPD